MYLSIMCSVKAQIVWFSLDFWLSESMHELESDPIHILFFFIWSPALPNYCFSFADWKKVWTNMTEKKIEAAIEVDVKN